MPPEPAHDALGAADLLRDVIAELRAIEGVLVANPLTPERTRMLEVVRRAVEALETVVGQPGSAP